MDHSMQVTEKKTDCRFTLNGRAFDAMIHLIEIRYNERILFWNGVVELTLDDMAKLGRLPPGAPMELSLPDGRTGFLNLHHIHMAAGYCELAGTGGPNQ